MKNKKLIITAVVTIILALAGVFFGIEYSQEDVDKISEGIETVVNIVDNQSTTEIPEAYIEDEQKLEEQETEERIYLLDQFLQLEPSQRMLTHVRERLIKEAIESSYKKAGENAAYGVEISKETVMNEIENLELKTYKNYKELCEAIGWKISTGNGKKAQLKELEKQLV